VLFFSMLFIAIAAKNTNFLKSSTQSKQSNGCFNGWKLKAAGIDTPIRLNRNLDIECLSIDGRNCAWGLIESDQACFDYLNTNALKIAPLTCGAMHNSLYGGPGYFTPGHWCEAGRQWFFETWHCPSETGIGTGIKYDWTSKNIECQSNDGKNCLWGSDQDCQNAKSNQSYNKPLICGPNHVAVYGQPDPYFANGNHWCKTANAWFQGPTGWICGGDNNLNDIPFRYTETGDIACFSLNAVDCAWGNGTGAACHLYIANNINNVKPLVCTTEYSQSNHWCTQLMNWELGSRQK